VFKIVKFKWVIRSFKHDRIITNEYVKVRVLCHVFKIVKFKLVIRSFKHDRIITNEYVKQLINYSFNT